MRPLTRNVLRKVALSITTVFYNTCEELPKSVFSWLLILGIPEFFTVHLNICKSESQIFITNFLLNIYYFFEDIRKFIE